MRIGSIYRYYMLKHMGVFERKYYATADIFISPSIITKQGDKEGLPVTLMEAASSGCFIITTALDGNKEIIKHKKNGLLLNNLSQDEIFNSVINMSKFLLPKHMYLYLIRKFDWRIIADRYKNLLFSNN